MDLSVFAPPPVDRDTQMRKQLEQDKEAMRSKKSNTNKKDNKKDKKKEEEEKDAIAIASAAAKVAKVAKVETNTKARKAETDVDRDDGIVSFGAGMLAQLQALKASGKLTKIEPTPIEVEVHVEGEGEGEGDNDEDEEDAPDLVDVVGSKSISGKTNSSDGSSSNTGGDKNRSTTKANSSSNRAAENVENNTDNFLDEKRVKYNADNILILKPLVLPKLDGKDVRTYIAYCLYWVIERLSFLLRVMLIELWHGCLSISLSLYVMVIISPSSSALEPPGLHLSYPAIL